MKVVLATGLEKLEKQIKEQLSGTEAEVVEQVYYLEAVYQMAVQKNADVVVLAASLPGAAGIVETLTLLRMENIRVVLLPDTADLAKRALGLGIYDIIMGGVEPSSVVEAILKPKTMKDAVLEIKGETGEKDGEILQRAASVFSSRKSVVVMSEMYVEALQEGADVVVASTYEEAVKSAENAEAVVLNPYMPGEMGLLDCVRQLQGKQVIILGDMLENDPQLVESAKELGATVVYGPDEIRTLILGKQEVQLKKEKEKGKGKGEAEEKAKERSALRQVVPWNSGLPSLEKKVKERNASIFTFWSPRPGSGCTTMLANISVLVARKLAGVGFDHPIRIAKAQPDVLAADMSGGMPPLSAMLGYSADVKKSKVDIRGLSVLDDASIYEINACKKRYRAIFVDAPLDFKRAAEIIEVSDTVVVVVTPDKHTINLVGERIKEIKKTVKRTYVIFNRYINSFVEQENVEKYLKCPVIACVEDNAELFMEATHGLELPADINTKIFTDAALVLLRRINPFKGLL